MNVTTRPHSEELSYKGLSYKGLIFTERLSPCLGSSQAVHSVSRLPIAAPVVIVF